MSATVHPRKVGSTERTILFNLLLSVLYPITKMNVSTIKIKLNASGYQLSLLSSWVNRVIFPYRKLIINGRKNSFTRIKRNAVFSSVERWYFSFDLINELVILRKARRAMNGLFTVFSVAYFR